MPDTPVWQTRATQPGGAIEGLTLFGYGHSYLAVGAAIAQRRYFERLAARLRSGVSFNDGAAGWLSVDVANYAHGAVGMNIGRGNGIVGTWNPAALVGGIVLLDLARNDAGWDGLGSGQYRQGFTNALDSLLRLLRASSSLQDTNAAFAYTGTWTSSANVAFPGQNAHETSTPGDHVTITTPAGTDFDLILIGFDTVLTGAAFTVSVDGQDITAQLAAAGYPTSLAAQLKQGKLTVQNWTPVAIPLRGLSNQAHTVVVTHAGAAGQYLYVARLLTPSPTPPTIVIPKIAQVPAAGYASYAGANASWATDQAYNQIIDTVAGRFGALSGLLGGAKATPDRSIVTWDPNIDGWQPGYISSQDAQQLHPGDQGMAFYADRLLTALNQLPFRLGQNTI